MSDGLILCMPTGGFDLGGPGRVTHQLRFDPVRASRRRR
jgi:hypothetical protein